MPPPVPLAVVSLLWSAALAFGCSLISALPGAALSKAAMSGPVLHNVVTSEAMPLQPAPLMVMLSEAAPCKAGMSGAMLRKAASLEAKTSRVIPSRAILSVPSPLLSLVPTAVHAILLPARPPASAGAFEKGAVHLPNPETNTSPMAIWTQRSQKVP